ncbi:MAG: DUF1800 domain-containing protein, partial [Pseudomonadota bacterium]|nr:DUF1800 domain-containing protein [Pseudomonadota bacterium]
MRRLVRVTALGLGLVVAACGGSGGSSSSSGGGTTAPPPPPPASQSPTPQEASKFLGQATFGPTA